MSVLLTSRRAAALFFLSAAVVVDLDAQPGGDVRLARFDEPTRAAIMVLVDSARADRLPTEPLVDKALEGGKKGADGERIVSAVRGLSAELRTARRALGNVSTSDEIIAGANALHAGLQIRDLTQLRSAARMVRRRHVTLPLTIVTDLVARRVPVTTATQVMISLTRSGVADDELALFQRNVRLDVDRGADPASAAQTRARGAMLRSGRT